MKAVGFPLLFSSLKI